MSSTNYVAGAVVRITGAFTASGTPTDPTTITLSLKGGTGGLVQFTYAASQIVRDSAGNYHYDYTIPASGQFFYRWEGTGAVIAAAEGSFVSTSAFK
jgi:hypothetical protein